MALVDLLEPSRLRLAFVADILGGVAPSLAEGVQIGGVRMADVVGQVESVEASLALVQDADLV